MPTEPVGGAAPDDRIPAAARPGDPTPGAAPERQGPAELVCEVLGTVLRVRDGALQVLLWRRGRPPAAGRWALTGGRLGADEDVEASAVRMFAG